VAPFRVFQQKRPIRRADFPKCFAFEWQVTGVQSMSDQFTHDSRASKSAPAEVASALPADSSDASDRELINAFVRERNQAAFAALLKRHGPPVLGVCRRILGNVQDAEDAFQGTFIVLAQKAGSIGRPDLLGSWLHGVASRTALMARRAASRRAAAEERMMRTLLRRTGSKPSTAELKSVLDEYIAGLPEKYRRVVVLRFLEGRSQCEAAQALSWPEGTVATRLSQALAILKQKLGADGFDAAGAALAAELAALKHAIVSEALGQTTLNAAISSGPASVGAASQNALALSKGVCRNMFIEKLKIVALIVACGGVIGTAATLQLAKRQQFQAQPPAPANVAAAPATLESQANPPASRPDLPGPRMRAATLAIIQYANQHQNHFPPDLGSTLQYTPRKAKGSMFFTPEDEAKLKFPDTLTADWINHNTSWVYLGNKDVTWAGLDRAGGNNVAKGLAAIVHQKLWTDDTAAIDVGFVDGHVERLSIKAARAVIEESKKKLDSLRKNTAK
jgi:RNA polymerase sigma-70 factor (ECF subfamily)